MEVYRDPQLNSPGGDCYWEKWYPNYIQICIYIIYKYTWNSLLFPPGLKWGCRGGYQLFGWNSSNFISVQMDIFFSFLATLICNSPSPDFVSKIIELPITESGGFLLLRLNTPYWMVDVVFVEAKKQRFPKWCSLPANLEGPFQLQTVSFLGWARVLFGVDASSLQSGTETSKIS